jgi:eukaryotic-like serine/threonine-protein kinase
LKRVRKGGLVALLLIVLAVVLAGCSGAALTNPGWTALAASQTVVVAVLPSGQVVALDPASGAEVWSYPLAQQSSGGGILGIFSKSSAPDQKPLDGVYGAPALADSVALVTSFDHNLYAFASTKDATQRKLWEYPVGGSIVGGVTVSSGMAYFGASDNRVYAVDIATQKEVWAQPFATGNWVWGAPAVDDQRIYVGSMDHFVYALDRQTGKLVWKLDVGGSIPGNITLADGTLYVGGVDQKLHAIDATKGTELWSSDMGHWLMGAPLVYNGVVYATSLDGTVHAIKLSDHGPLWAAIKLDGAVRAGPALVGQSLIVGTATGSVYKIDPKTGTSDLFFKATGSVYAMPAVQGNTVYIGTTLGNVYALDVTRPTGSQSSWTYPQPKK